MRPSPNSTWRPLAALLLAVTVHAGVHAAEQRTEYSTVDLVAEQASLPTAGGTVTLGLHLEPDSGWHAYWTNPGDAGKEASIRWTLPEGFEAGELQFPVPHVITLDIFNTYGFDEAILLLTDIAVPPLEGGSDVELKGRASWVVCDDELCVPEGAELRLTLPVGDGADDADNEARFAAARAKQPEAVDWPARFEVVDDRVNIGITLPHAALEPYLFVETRRLVRYDAQSSAETATGLRFSMAAGTRADRIEATRAVLSYQDDDGQPRSVLLDVGRADGSLDDAMATAGTASPAGSGGAAGTTGTTTTASGVATAILFGLLGGIILNLMPCVFPILSMKALGLVELSGADRRTARSSGVFYTIGILVAFTVIAVVLIVLREAGTAAGWGFQMQLPLVNLGLGLLMVAIGLNLAGVYEFGLGLMGVGESLTADAGSEQRKAFLTGLLAVLVATPCTAPFMAGALGYALSQPAVVALAVFLALGLGLALPYLLLSFAPGLGRMLPRPGPWMAKLRAVLAFPMLATALWLFWIVGRQLGASSMAVALLAALLLAFGLWAYGQAAGATRRWAWHATGVAGLVGCLVLGAQMEEYRAEPQVAGEASAGTLGKLELEHFSAERVVGYIDEGQPLFVYFTADWCLSCKANERAALATDAVGDAMTERGIKVVEADWTTEDPVITEWLEMYDRVGVPLYLYFPQGSTPATAAVLPQLLLPNIVIDAIDAADNAATVALAEWGPIQTYLDLDKVWHEIDDEIAASDAAKEEKDRRREEERGPHPDIGPATAAAKAIVALGGEHERTVDAAAFLAEETANTDDVALGAVALLRHAPDHEDWPLLLWNVDFRVGPGDNEAVDALFETMANDPTNAVRAATARYYLASRYIRQVNDIGTAAEDREKHREAAFAAAEGLSAGVENEPFRTRRDRDPITIAEAQKNLLNSFSFAVGRALPDVQASTLDGTEESFSAYADQVVLLDFWATWCGPCVKSLPKLRELDESLPDERFEILSISVDAELDTVTEFQVDEPMPWANWHIGPKSDILKTWVVRGYPTYLLVDGDGTVLARTHDLNDDLAALIERTVNGMTS